MWDIMFWWLLYGSLKINSFSPLGDLIFDGISTKGDIMKIKVIQFGVIEKLFSGLTNPT